MATALITGGCGFVGRHLTRFLLDKGLDVTIVDNLSNGKHPISWSTGKLEFLNEDCRVFFARDRRKFDYAFHLAAIIGGRTQIDGNPIYVANNINFDIAFFEWSLKQKPKIIFYPSSSAVYPIDLQTDEKRIILKEDDLVIKDKKIGFPDMTYGWAKMTGELLAHLVKTKSKDLNIKIARPFSGYGAGQDEDYPVTAIAKRIIAHQNPLEVWGPEYQGRDFIYISDVIEAIWTICNLPSDYRHDTFNIATGVVLTFNQIANEMASIEGYCPMITNLVNKPTGVLNRVGDKTRIFETGWRPTVSVRSGLELVLQWLKDGRTV